MQLIKLFAMEFSDFKCLDFHLQAHTIYQSGVYLGERSEDDLLVALYGVHDFYVEVYYLLSKAEIIKFISFHSDAMLEPYLNRIQLARVLSEFAVTLETC